MSLGSMRQELLGIAGMNFGLATTRLQEAFQAIQNEQVWSFQLQVGGFLTPGLLGWALPYPGGAFPSVIGQPPGIQGGGWTYWNEAGWLGTGQNGPIFPNMGIPNWPEERFRQGERAWWNFARFLSPGLITVKPGTNTVTGDPIATQAWNATIANPPLLTQQQIRSPYYSLYNIIALGNNGTISYATVTSPGSEQLPGTYQVPVSDYANVGSGGMIQVVVASDGTVQMPPTVLNAGSGYLMPYITFAPPTPGTGYGEGGYGEGGYGGTATTETAATFGIVLQAQLTLDRLWEEPNMVNAGYMIYQAYFPMPKGFKRFYYILDTTNNYPINWWSYTQVNLSEMDAQRINFLQPTHLVPWGIDIREGSATFGQMLYELWPHPIMQLPYTWGAQIDWTQLTNAGDTVPYPLTDELVKMRAYEMLYLWKEGQRGDEMERGSGSNNQFLVQAMRAEYDDRLKRCRNMDRHLVDLYFTKARRYTAMTQPVFGTVNGMASVGGWDS